VNHGRGGGKYDELASYVREQADADCVVVVVINGNKGQGFEVHLRSSGDAGNADALHDIAMSIRGVADAMQADARHLRARARGN
jgi:hypothetical protein